MKNFSGANFCFWVSASVVFILVLFSFIFCFLIWFVVPENVSRKFSSGQVRCLNFRVRTFVLWCRCWSVGSFSPSRMGKCCPFFFHFVFLCLVRCLLSFFYRSSFLRVVVWKNFREQAFVFVCRCGSCVFWCCFAYVFALLFAFSLPKLSRKNSLDVRSGVFWLSSFFLWFFRRRRRSFFF